MVPVLEIDGRLLTQSLAIPLADFLRLALLIAFPAVTLWLAGA